MKKLKIQNSNSMYKFYTRVVFCDGSTNKKKKKRCINGTGGGGKKQCNLFLDKIIDVGEMRSVWLMYSHYGRVVLEINNVYFA